MKKRIRELDFLKGIAIVLVVVGHSVSQIISGDPDVYEENPLFRFIYSFHMPLFTFISGYICRLTLKTDTAWLRKRVRQIGTPYLLALILWYGILRRESLADFLSPMAYWYLPFVLIADTVLFCEIRFRLKGLLFAAVIAASLLICKFETSQIDIAHHLAHCLIFYAAGAAAPGLKETHGDKRFPIYCILSAGFILLTPVYGQGMDRQLSRLERLFGLKSTNSVQNAVIFAMNKFVVPVCGIGFVLLLTYVIYRVKPGRVLRRIMETVGQHTLFIYILHDLCFLRITGSAAANCVISVFTAIIIPLLISLGFVRIRAVAGSSGEDKGSLTDRDNL